MAVKLGETIQLNILYQPTIIQQCNVSLMPNFNVTKRGYFYSEFNDTQFFQIP